MNRLICLRLVDPRLDGVWMEVRPDGQVQTLVSFGQETEMVPTGNVEWDGDQCAEVWIPATMLPVWRAEHDVER